jgi:hypothetical protein
VSSPTHVFIRHTRLAIVAQTTNGETEKGLSDTYDDYHDYTVSLSIVSHLAQLTGHLDRLASCLTYVVHRRQNCPHGPTISY